MNPEPEEIGFQLETASSWQLTWRRFRRHKLAFVSLILLGFLYLVALLADFLATADPNRIDASRAFLPPQPIHLRDDRGFNPHVHPVSGEWDHRIFRRVHRIDPDRKLPVRLLVRGYEYDFLGLIPTDLHLIGVEGEIQALSLLGTDGLGRDLFSRLVHGTRTSLTIGLVGVILSLVLGVVLGGISGFYGGAVDTVIQRIIEILLSIPTIPLWLGLAAAMPRDWGVLRVYFMGLIYLSALGIQFWHHAFPNEIRSGAQGKNPSPENVQGGIVVPVHSKSAGPAPEGFAPSWIVAGAAPVAVLRGICGIHFYELPTGPFCLVLELIPQKPPGLRHYFSIQPLLRALRYHPLDVQLLHSDQTVLTNDPAGETMAGITVSDRFPVTEPR